MYSVDRTTGQLTFLSDNRSSREHDGPRHVAVSPDGNMLYSVTEHSNFQFLLFVLYAVLTPHFSLASFIDIYNVTSTDLAHLQSISILPPGSNYNNYRGDTLRLHPPTPEFPSPTHLFATTRGTNTNHKGYLTVFSILPSGLLDTTEGKIERWETPTSGGKANAIELKAKTHEDGGSGEGVWITLTDDEPDAGGLWMLEWDGEGRGGVKVVAEWSGDGHGPMNGASHAVWLN